jgi:hypothetical protein
MGLAPGEAMPEIAGSLCSGFPLLAIPISYGRDGMV